MTPEQLHAEVTAMMERPWPTVDSVYDHLIGLLPPDSTASKTWRDARQYMSFSSRRYNTNPASVQSFLRGVQQHAHFRIVAAHSLFVRRLSERHNAFPDYYPRILNVLINHSDDADLFQVGCVFGEFLLSDWRRNGRVAVDSRPYPSHCLYVSPRPVTPAGVTFKRLRGIEEIMPVTDEMYQRMVGMLNMPPAPGKFVTIQVPDVEIAEDESCQP